MSFNNHLLQLPHGSDRHSIAKAKVALHQLLDGGLIMLEVKIHHVS